MNEKTDPTLASLGRLVGAWTTEATHPDMPGVVVHGTADVEWLEGERFLLLRSRTDHPDFPDALSVIGHMDQDRVDESKDGKDNVSTPPSSPLRMQYFDSRGVYRLNDTRVTDAAWEWWRESPGFSQRFTGRFEDGGDTIVGQSQLRRDDVHWKDDLAITYRRKGTR